ncbi:peptide-methionine (S)-S-oxide reductase [Patescibacteria group bacterium]|nr:MAG: peptide-methionine (S)-S-oxide reductase [Patescibacteria group bacterium]
MVKTENIVLGGGCFWCLDASFSRVKGVIGITVGYAGGENHDPSYELVCSGKSGHAEVVRIEFDPAVISLEDVLRIFFSIHDPTTLNRQGGDVGSQYRSVILYQNMEQFEIAKKIMDELRSYYDSPMVTDLVSLENFYPADEYHQKYFKKNPSQAYCQLVILPKLAKLKEKYSQYYLRE